MEDLKEGIESQNENATTLSSVQETTSSIETVVDATSEEVTAEADVDGVEFPQNEVTAISRSPQVTGYAAAIAAATSGEVASDEETYLEIEAYSSSTFSPNTNENRAILVRSAVNGDYGNLKIVRTGKSDSQGGFIKHDEVLANFDLDVVELMNDIPEGLVLTSGKMQVSLVLANGKTLVGYITLSKSRKGFYFQKKLAEQTLTLPASGQRQPIRVKTLIIG